MTTGAYCTVLVFAILFAWMLWRKDKEVHDLRKELESVGEENDIVLDFMHKIVAEVASGADKHSVYLRILRSITLACGATSACIYERNSKNNLVAVESDGLFPPQREINPLMLKTARSRADFIDKILKGEELEPYEGIIGQASESGEPVFIKRAESSARVVNHKDAALRITSIMAIPMMFRGEFYGVLALANPIGGEYFSDLDFSIACSIADQSALSLYSINAFNQLVEKSKMDSDLTLAKSVQSYILPEKLYSINGFDSAARYMPQQKVGGDFYDTFDLGSGKIGAVIGDVSGKGVSAAIIMAICQSKLRYLASRYSSPSETLKALNSEMVVAMRSDMFVTMVYAIFDTTKNKVSIARAGHEKPLVFSAEAGVADFVKSKGIAIGMVSSEIFDCAIYDVERPFGVGDVMMLYSDGVTEAVNPDGEEFSTGRLKNVLEKTASLAADEINEFVTREVAKFSCKSRPTDDDFTLLTIKRVG